MNPIIETPEINTSECPFCHSDELELEGWADGVGPRFTCYVCGETFESVLER
jgi:transposase-like protein